MKTKIEIGWSCLVSPKKLIFGSSVRTYVKGDIKLFLLCPILFVLLFAKYFVTDCGFFSDFSQPFFEIFDF